MIYDKLIKNIEKLSADKGINKTTALVESGVGKNFIWNINKGSAPSTEKIQKLADYFGVSTDYLLGNINDPQHSKSDVDPQTAEALELYKALTDENRELVLQMMKGLLKK